jgi:hypothetical protein
MEDSSLCLRCSTEWETHPFVSAAPKQHGRLISGSKLFVSVLDPGKGVCADPVNGAAILGKGGPDSQGGNKERQLSPDKGREKM